MMCRKVLGAMVSLGFVVGAASAQTPFASSLSTAMDARPGNQSLIGSPTQSLTLDFDADRLFELNAENPSMLGSFYNANPSPPWRLSLLELASGPEVAKLQPTLVVSAAPEPSAIALLGLGGLLMVGLFRRRNSKRPPPR